LSKKKNNIEYKLKNDDILYFLHIPKSGGTNLRTILENNFEFDNILYEHVWEDLLKKIPTDFSKYKLIIGHFGYRLYRILPKQPVYMTMLRDPVEQVISVYEYSQLRSTQDQNRNLFSTKSLDELLNDSHEILRFTNIQTRQIAADMNEELFKEICKKTSYGNASYSQISLSELYNNTYEDKFIKIAKQHLSEFAFFGLVERYEESLFLLSYTFGWRPIRNITKKNASINRLQYKDLSKQIMNLILECTTLDRELYFYAKQLFEDRFLQMVHELKNTYYKSSFKNMPFLDMVYEMLEMHYSKHFTQSNKIVQSIKYSFDKPISGDGWHERYRGPKNDEILVWTGPNTTSTIDLPLTRNCDLKIQIYIVSHMAHDILKSLKLKVNNNFVILKIHQEESIFIFDGIIPKHILQSEKTFTRLKFQVCRTISPHSINQTCSDTRQLGLAFKQILICPLV